MRENKKIEKELLFKNNIKDITSISLDRDFKVDKNKIVGNFLINGDYKIHEVSINREKFNFKIPFEHEIENDIDTDTIKLEIKDFVYDYNKDELIVNIEYEINADRKDILLFDNEESLEEFLSTKEVDVIDTRVEEIKEEIDNDSKIEVIDLLKEMDNETNNIQEKEKIDNEEEIECVCCVEDEKEIEVKEQNIEEIKCVDINDNIEEIETKLESEDRDMIESDEIINSVSNIEDGFVTYKVYKIKENDTLESLVVKYHTTIDELKEYNDINNLKIDDKIIIPMYE